MYAIMLPYNCRDIVFRYSSSQKSMNTKPRKNSACANFIKTAVIIYRIYYSTCQKFGNIDFKCLMILNEVSYAHKAAFI